MAKCLLPQASSMKKQGSSSFGGNVASELSDFDLSVPPPFRKLRAREMG